MGDENSKLSRTFGPPEVYRPVWPACAMFSQQVGSVHIVESAVPFSYDFGSEQF